MSTQAKSSNVPSLANATAVCFVVGTLESLGAIGETPRFCESNTRVEMLTTAVSSRGTLVKRHIMREAFGIAPSSYTTKHILYKLTKNV